MSPFLLYALGVATGIMCALPKLWPWSWIGIAIIGVVSGLLVGHLDNQRRRPQ